MTAPINLPLDKWECPKAEVVFLKILSALFATAVFFVPPAIGADTGTKKIEVGETSIGGYMEFSFFDDRGIGWTGSEGTLTTRVKLDLKHRPYENILIRAKGVWSPTASEYSRAYDSLRKKEGAPEDIYAQFENLFGKNATLRTGVVKVPFGHFDTMALEERNRPVSLGRTREWDIGARLDAKLAETDFSFALINGDGCCGTDSNSAKSVALRIAYPASGGQIYPETQEVTRYPNPRTTSAEGSFSWRVGLSGYVGQKYSTPVKVRNSRYAADIQAGYGGIFSFKAQYAFMEGGFTDPASALNDNLDQYGYSDAVTTSMDTFPRGYAFFSEFSISITANTLLTLMAETYDPDSESDATVQQKTKTRIVIGLKKDFKPGVSGVLLYTLNNDPAFGETGNVAQNDSWKGDEVIMAGIALQF